MLWANFGLNASRLAAASGTPRAVRVDCHTAAGEPREEAPARLKRSEARTPNALSRPPTRAPPAPSAASQDRAPGGPLSSAPGGARPSAGLTEVRVSESVKLAPYCCVPVRAVRSRRGDQLRGYSRAVR